VRLDGGPRRERGDPLRRSRIVAGEAERSEAGELPDVATATGGNELIELGSDLGADRGRVGRSRCVRNDRRAIGGGDVPDRRPDAAERHGVGVQRGPGQQRRRREEQRPSGKNDRPVGAHPMGHGAPEAEEAKQRRPPRQGRGPIGGH
jgi:hypothetical protein